MPRLLPTARRPFHGSPGASGATLQPSLAGAHPSCTRTEAGWRPGWSSMPFAFAVLDERLDVVIVQPRFVTHGSGFDPEPTAARLVVYTHQRRSQQIIECVPERRSPGLAFTFNSGHHIVIERNGGS